jgi:hypothetical protein
MPTKTEKPPKQPIRNETKYGLGWSFNAPFEVRRHRESKVGRRRSRAGIGIPHE